MKNKKHIKTLSLILVLALNFANISFGTIFAASQDSELNSIFNGQEPTIKLANEKVSSLKNYASKKFKDIKSTEWYANNLSMLVGLNGIDGYNDGTFRPKNPIKTSEFIKLLLAAAGYKQEIDKDVWYKNYVTKAKELGVIEDSDGYSYDSQMNRADMAKMICRMLKIQPQSASTPVFTDVGGVDTRWIDPAFNEYLIRGYYSKKIRTFKPTNTATRAEVTEMIVRALEYRDDPAEYKIKMKAYSKEIEREQDLTDGTYVMPPLTDVQRKRLNSYPENQKAETNVMSGQYMSNKEVVKHFTNEYLTDLIRKAKGYIEADNNVDYHVVDLLYKNEIKKYMSPTGMFVDKDGNKVSNDEELNKTLKYTKDNKAVVEGTFITDNSMIYICDDGRVRIKGVMRWKVKEHIHPEKLSVKVGVLYESDEEIELAKWDKDKTETFSKIIDLNKYIPIGE